MHQLYALEGFLARLAISPYKENLVLKAGVLLAAYDLRRPTRDIDFQGRDISMDDEQILRIVREIADIPLDDGISFHTEAASAETIRDEDAYTGVRITFTGTLSVARLVLYIDEPFPTSLSLLFDGLKDPDRGDDRGRSAGTAAEFGEEFPGFERGHRSFAGSAVAGVVGIHDPLVG